MIRLRRWLAPRWRSEDGFSALELALGVGLLLIPVTMLVVALPIWMERQSAARLASQEAARVVATAGDQASGMAAGRSLAARIGANHAIPEGDLDIAISGSLVRGGQIAVTVTVVMPALPLPWLDEHTSFQWSTTHTESVDLYRSFP